MSFSSMSYARRRVLVVDDACSLADGNSFETSPDLKMQAHDSGRAESPRSDDDRL